MTESEDTTILSLPIACLPPGGRNILSWSLDPEKIIYSDGPVRRPRDWRGLASCVNITETVATYINNISSDKTYEVLSRWQKSNRSATVGELLQHLRCIDRYDVAEDLYNFLKEVYSGGELSPYTQNHIVPISSTQVSTAPDTDFITRGDRPGYIQLYDALVLYADEDADFAETLMARLNERHFQVCTMESVQVGETTTYAAVARLIAERCRRVIVLLSPAFLECAVNRFYTNYATAVGIDREQYKLLPIMYRFCELGDHPLHHIHKLSYEYGPQRRENPRFWMILFETLEQTRMITNYHQDRCIQQRPPQQTITPRIAIHECPPSDQLADSERFNPQKIPIPTQRLETTSLPILTTSLPILTTSDTNLSTTSILSENIRKKKKNYFSKFYKKVTGKKTTAT